MKSTDATYAITSNFCYVCSSNNSQYQGDQSNRGNPRNEEDRRKMLTYLSAISMKSFSLIQSSGNVSQSVTHLNRSHAIHPIGGVRTSPLSKPFTLSLAMHIRITIQDTPTINVRRCMIIVNFL